LEHEDFISSGNIDINGFWQNVLDEIAKELSAVSFDVWIKNLAIEDIKENVVVLSAETKSAKNLILKNYKDIIISCAHKVYSAINQIEIVVKEDDYVEVQDKTSGSKPRERVYVDENTPRVSLGQKKTFTLTQNTHLKTLLLEATTNLLQLQQRQLPKIQEQKLIPFSSTAVQVLEKLTFCTLLETMFKKTIHH